MNAMPLILVVVLIGYAWWETIGAKRQARAAARRACVRATVRFLDELALARIRLRRSPGGRVRLWRQYTFEFCIDGDVRFPGRIDLLGRRVTRIELAGHVVSAAADGAGPADIVSITGRGNTSADNGSGYIRRQ